MEREEFYIGRKSIGNDKTTGTSFSMATDWRLYGNGFLDMTAQHL